MSRAVIVGASSEIGRAISVFFATRHCDLDLWGRDPGRLAATGVACTAAGAASATETVIDVRDVRMLRSAAREAAAPGDVTHVVWAAGAFQWGGFDTADEQAMDDVLTTVFTAAAAAARAFLPSLVRNAPSSLIFIGSGAGTQAYPDNAAYVAAKHGVRGLAHALHLDVCDRGVTVSVISAGLVDAGAGRSAPAAATHRAALLRPTDLARTVQFIVDSPANVCPTEIVLRPATRYA